MEIYHELMNSQLTNILMAILKGRLPISPRIRYFKCMKCDCVLPNLFIGPNPIDEVDFAQLQAMRITAILSLQSKHDVNQSEFLSRQSMATERALIFHNFPVVDFDRADLRRKLPDCVRVLDDLLKSGEIVYLHCTAGVSRSPTVAAAFLHWKLGWPIDDALSHVRAVRNCCPDDEVIRSEAARQDSGT